MVEDSAKFEIWLVWSDRRLKVDPGMSALDVLLLAGVPIEPGGRTLACGECATDYIEGDVIHKDACVSGKERAAVLSMRLTRPRHARDALLMSIGAGSSQWHPRSALERQDVRRLAAVRPL